VVLDTAGRNSVFVRGLVHGRMWRMSAGILAASSFMYTTLSWEVNNRFE
jgi:hypothetical protein